MMVDRNEPVVVYRGPHVAAGYLKGLLEDAGIEAHLWGEVRQRRGSLLTPEKGFGVDVAVRRRDLERAQPIVDNFLKEKLFDQLPPFGASEDA